MNETIFLIILGWIALMLTVIAFKKPALTPDQAADEKKRAQIMDKLNRAIDDIKSTV